VLGKPATAADALRMAFKAKKVSLGEQVQKSIGLKVFWYYRYLDYFKIIPSSLDDMIDGLIYIHLMSKRES
jgi:hypothetical protein